MTAWRRFWEGPTPFPDSTWTWQARIFLRGASEVFPIGSGDSVVDIGCGSGALASLLSAKGIKRYTGLDISASALSLAREKLSGRPAFRFELLGDDPFDFSPAWPGGYSRLLALSVVQYYRETSELTRLLQAMHTLAAPGAILLVADLPLQQNGGVWAETWRTLKRAGELRALGRQILFIARCGFSGYRRVRRQAGLLAFDKTELLILAGELARTWRAETRLIEEPLTVSEGRVHLWIRLPPA